jgi:ABC-type Mn2+/Zn2+ transport system permease subunit
MLCCLWAIRRPLLFWAIDEDSAHAFGVPVLRIKVVLMTLLALSIVIAMKLTGVVLATALLALPGAIALKLTSRIRPCIAVSLASALAALVLGLYLSVLTNWPAGPSIVAVLVALFAASLPVKYFPRAISQT